MGWGWSNYIHIKLWVMNIHPCPNFRQTAVEYVAWVGNYITEKSMDIITNYYFINDMSIVIQIQWKFRFALIWCSGTSHGICAMDLLPDTQNGGLCMHRECRERFHCHQLPPDTQNCGFRMSRECRECFPRHRGLAIPACITARVWRMCRDACRDR